MPIPKNLFTSAVLVRTSDLANLDIDFCSFFVLNLGGTAEGAYEASMHGGVSCRSSLQAEEGRLSTPHDGSRIQAITRDKMRTNAPAARPTKRPTRLFCRLLTR
jgi:hypothetical protein